MSIWIYGDVSRQPAVVWSRSNCVFCRAGLKLLHNQSEDMSGVKVRGFQHERVLACPVCGWWKAERVREFENFVHRFRDYMLDGAAASLRELDLSDVSAPISEVRSYLSANNQRRGELDPKLFEETVADVFRDHGYRAEVTAYSGDGGIDVILSMTPGTMSTGHSLNDLIREWDSRRAASGSALGGRRRPVLADDDVIVHRDAERDGDVDHRLGHPDVGLRRSRIAGGMVVHQDDGAGRQFERALHHLARIDRGVVHGADLLHFIGDQLVALVEKQDPKLFLVGKGHRGPAIIDHAGPCRQHGALLELTTGDPARGGGDQADFGDRRVAQPTDLAKPRLRGMDRFGERTEFLDQRLCQWLDVAAWDGAKQHHLKQFVIVKRVGAGPTKALPQPFAMAVIMRRLDDGGRRLGSVVDFYFYRHGRKHTLARASLLCRARRHLQLCSGEYGSGGAGSGLNLAQSAIGPPSFMEMRLWIVAWQADARWARSRGRRPGWRGPRQIRTSGPEARDPAAFATG
jgi:hypothetical protein